MERILHNQDWLAVSAGLSTLCNGWANRRDLYVYLGRDGGQGKASAFYEPDSGAIEINSEDAFGPGSDGSRIGDITRRTELSKYPVAGGLAVHESGHARFSTADWAQVQKRFTKQSAFGVFKLLEETRIEGRMAKLFPRDRGYLRASCKTLIMKGSQDEWRPRGIMQLIVGREAVGVLDPTDTVTVEQWLVSQDGWSAGIIHRAKEIIVDFSMLTDSGSDLDAMILLAIELDNLMPDEPDGGEDGDGENGEGEGAFDGLPGAIAAALDKAAREGAIEVIGEADMAAAQEKREKQEKQNAEHEVNVDVAKDTFEDSAGGDSNVPAQLRSKRPPTGVERGAAVALARDLEKARYRDRSVIESGSLTPPGRFNGAEAMQMTAARQKGGRTDMFNPYRQKKRVQHEDPPLTVGIMADVSGSMSASQPTVATATWVISDATYRVGNASSAMTYFGHMVYPGLRKGERLRHVREWTGQDGWEEFNKGFRALDGELNLLNGTGARLLVVVSDGQYGAAGQAEARDKWLQYCVRNGVGVVWLTPRGERMPTELSIPGVEIVQIANDVLAATKAIGSACIRALERVSGV
jgi:hypothetical protein